MTVIGPRAAIPSTGETRSENQGRRDFGSIEWSASLPGVLPPVSIRCRVVVLYVVVGGRRRPWPLLFPSLSHPYARRPAPTRGNASERVFIAAYDFRRSASG